MEDQNTTPTPQQPRKKQVKRRKHFPTVAPQRVKPAPSRLRQAYGFPEK